MKLGDFGLATTYSPGGEMSHQVMTRWYRAPELLYGSRHYDCKVDIWSAGCIFAELLNGGEPLFPGESDIDQLGRVVRALGDPTPERWPGVDKLPDYNKILFKCCGDGVPMETLVPNASEAAIDLLCRMLCYDSAQRISAKDALQHSYFTDEPPRLRIGSSQDLKLCLSFV